MIIRTIEQELRDRFFKGKAILILGPRQVGKTTLLKTILDGKAYLFLNGDDPDTRQLLEGAGSFALKQIIGEHTLVFIDEAQRIERVGLTLKLIIDNFSGVQVLVSGSSALELRDSMQESLTGRKWEYRLYPISFQEFENQFGYLEAERQFEQRIIYGMYPDVINHPGKEKEILRELTGSYLYKDILALTGIRKPELLERLLQALALQVGSEVSYTELSGLLGIDKNTVMHYIDILEKAFIVYRLRSFSRNQRNEIRNNRKIYFVDNGIRNMLISNFNSLALRNDKGALWENFLITERIKKQEYAHDYVNRYFWRTVQKQEIDYIEESNGKIVAYEFKWKQDSRKKFPASFLDTYQAEGKYIDRDNFREFVGEGYNLV